MIVTEQGNAQGPIHRRIFDLPLIEGFAGGARFLLEKRPDLDPCARPGLGHDFIFGRGGLGVVQLAKTNRHGNRDRIDAPDKNAAVTTIIATGDLTDVHKTSFR
jgi:hypothetical protein